MPRQNKVNFCALHQFNVCNTWRLLSVPEQLCSCIVQGHDFHYYRLLQKLRVKGRNANQFCINFQNSRGHTNLNPVWAIFQTDFAWFRKPKAINRTVRARPLSTNSVGGKQLYLEHSWLPIFHEHCFAPKTYGGSSSTATSNSLGSQQAKHHFHKNISQSQSSVAK